MSEVLEKLVIAQVVNIPLGISKFFYFVHNIPLVIPILNPTHFNFKIHFNIVFNVPVFQMVFSGLVFLQKVDRISNPSHVSYMHCPFYPPLFYPYINVRCRTQPATSSWSFYCLLHIRDWPFVVDHSIDARCRSWIDPSQLIGLGPNVEAGTPVM